MPRRKGIPTRSIPRDGTSSPPSPPLKKLTAKKDDPIDCLFESYANKSSGLIDPDGIEALCNDLNVHYADVRILILAWKMKAENQGFFSKDEWRRGLQSVGADTITKLRKEIDGLEKEVINSECFKDFYSYAFQYNLIGDRQRTVDINSACELLNMVLRPVFPFLVDLLLEYLKTQNEFGAVNRDQWISFYYFFKEVDLLCLDSYDPSQAWPVIIDNFVEWLRMKQR